jgi:hypothetical protein
MAEPIARNAPNASPAARRRLKGCDLGRWNKAVDTGGFRDRSLIDDPCRNSSADCASGTGDAKPVNARRGGYAVDPI